MQQDGVAFNMDIDIIGTPDEEATGCKVDMCNAGVFKDYDLAIMFTSMVKKHDLIHNSWH